MGSVGSVASVLLLGAFAALLGFVPAVDGQDFAFDPDDVRIVRLDGVDRADVTLLTRSGFNVSHVRGSSAEVYLLVDRMGELREMGFDPVVLPHPKPTAEHGTGYHSHAEITADLQAVAAAHPNICRLESIGNSVQGRELWFMKITDNPDVEEDEPEFKYIASMHGDEPVGMELSLLLIDLLTDDYGVDSQITDLVNEVEIWIMPHMNPDGYTAGTRWNANGFDLNRNFPDRVDDPVNTTAGRQLETQHVMNWAFQHSSVLSANLHTGALVVNYPYDSDPNPFASYSASPDDALLIQQSLVYSVLNGPMFASPFFSQGITNGVEWYTAHGGMQDWNYVWMGCNEVTLELSNTKWPSYSSIAGLWNDNRDSLLAYMEQCLEGIRGVVTDSGTGMPVAATVRAVGIDHDVYTDPDVGDYHRMLLPGTYDLEFSAPGYATKVVSGIVVGSGAATRVDVTMDSIAWTDLGSSLAGTGGISPVLTGAGPLTGDSFNSFTLTDALAGATAHLFFGVSQISAPFKGGVLEPAPDILLPGLTVGPGGDIPVPFVWTPGIPAGFTMYLQYWIEDAGGVFGFAASNGVAGEAQ